MLARLASAADVSPEWLLNGTDGRLGPENRAWDAAVAALRVAWRQPRRRQTVVQILRALGGRSTASNSVVAKGRKVAAESAGRKKVRGGGP